MHQSLRPTCRTLALLSTCAWNVLGCRDLTLTGSEPLPAGTPDPSSYNTPAGARGMRNAAVYQFETVLPTYITETGLLTDELADRESGASLGVRLANQGELDALDARILPELGEGVDGAGAAGLVSYLGLQQVRELGNQAIGALVTYDTTAADTASAQVMRGEMYALEGYAELMLADFFCSGVPLSTLDFQKDYTVHASSTTTQVYEDALSKLDTSATLSRDSVRILNMARVGQGRVLLDLGQYGPAAAAVAAVPDTFQYQLTMQWACVHAPYSRGCGTVSDREGRTGLAFLSDADPRTAVDTLLAASPAQGGPFVTLTFPEKYSAAMTSGSTPVTLASGVEARLIQAEVALHQGQVTSMLATLNALRANAAANTHGRVPTLPAILTDPGAALTGAAADSARVALLFRERAYWLFLDGHRQGDLRRLVRNYGRLSTQTYPTGNYLAPGASVYGSDVNAPIPPSEYTNQLFHGCLDRRA